MLSRFAGSVMLDPRTLAALAVREDVCSHLIGPDDVWGPVEIWNGGRAVLAQRSLLTGCTAREKPASRSVSPMPFPMVGSVRLDNRRELLEELQMSEQSSDLDLVQAIAGKYGCERFIHHIAGDFAFALWDEAAATLFCYCDPLRLRRFYYRILPERFVFSWSADMLVHENPLSDEIDLHYFARYLRQGQPRRDDMQTPFRRVLQVPLGHRVVVRDSKVQVERYWYPERIGTLRLRDPHEYSAAFRHILEQAMSSRLPEQGPGWFDLSGGMDSSSLVALARHLQIARGGTPRDDIRCRAIVHPAMPEFSEREYVDLAAAHFDVTVSYESFEDLPPMAGIVEPDYEAPSEPSLSFLALPDIRRLCRQITHSGGAVHFTGHGADHLLVARNFSYMRKLLFSGRWSRLWSDLNGWSDKSCLPLVHFLICDVLFPSWFARFAVDRPQHATWLTPQTVRMDKMQKDSARLRVFRKAGQRHFEHMLDGANLGTEVLCASAQFGVEEMLPYLDLRVLEFVLSMPAEERTRPPLTKWLSRDAFADLLPQKILGKWRQPTGDIPFLWKLRRCHGELSRIVAQPLLGDLGLVNVSALHADFESLLQGDTKQIMDFATLLSIEFWLRKPRFRRTGPTDPALMQTTKEEKPNGETGNDACLHAPNNSRLRYR